MRLRTTLVTSVSVVLAFAAMPAGLVAQQKARLNTLDEAIAASSILGGRSGPRSVNWIDDGNRFSYIARDPQSGESTIRAMDPASGRDTLLFSARGLLFPGSSDPFTYESFQWARDSKHLVFQTRFTPIYRRSGTADYFIYSLADRKLQLAASGARTAELSPDGAMVGFERGGDMYVRDLGTRQERRLTSDATEHRYNGHFDWVYEEEFGEAQAWKWAPDSRHIAYWQTDDSKEPVWQLTDYAGQHPEWDRYAYPKVGDPNATVRIGVADVKSGKQVWLNTGDTAEFYIPRIYWTASPDTLAVITLDRPQQVMTLWFFDVNTGGKRRVMQDRSSTWIDVYDFYAGVNDLMTFPAGVREFWWLSDRDGYQHLYRYGYDGKLIQQVTKGPWMVTRIEGYDPATRTVYYTGTEASPLQRQLYAVRTDGTNKRRLTTTAGRHQIDMAPNGRFYIDRWSSTRQPRQVELWSAAGAGRKLRTIEDNAQTSQWLGSHAYSPEVPFRFRTSDGVSIDASMIRPVPFDSTRRYPVVFAVYGGPGSQAVYDQFNANGFEQWLAQQGYIVVDVNNRGTNNYGRDFMKTVYRNLGKWESHDFAETAKYLATLPYVDAKHVAMIGTSYGGYSTLFTMEQYPDLFPVGIANSPPADWRLYDTIYTERYMGLLGDNLAGYEASSPIVNAKKLTGQLMLIHSLMDDNVHVQNTMQLLTALTENGKDVPLRIYPPGHHGAAYDYPSLKLIDQVMTEFLAKNLKGEEPQHP